MKRILKNPLLPLLLAVCICVIFGVFMSDDPFPAKEIYGYKPMVCINDRVYGEIGAVTKSPPEGFKLAGTVKEKVSSLEPMVERNFTANMLDAGTEIFTSEENLEEIYIKLEESKYSKYIHHAEEESD